MNEVVANGFDISSLKPNEAIFEIRHPKTNDLLGIRVGLRSIDDKGLQRHKRRIRDGRIALEKKGKAFSAAEEDENERTLIFAAMTFWDWYVPELEPAKEIPAKGDEPARTIPAVMGERPTFHGEIPTFNQKTVYAVFDELPWLQEQLADKCAETKSFFD